MGLDRVTLDDAIQPLNAREGKNEEEVVLTSDRANQARSLRLSAPVSTSLSFPDDE